MSADRAILHSDMNSFYASVEMMLNPKLRGKAVAVCGSTENRHGIVLAKSELAKRAGVKTGMVNWEAKQRCKDLILVPPQYDQYLKYSRLAHEIYYRYTDRFGGAVWNGRVLAGCDRLRWGTLGDRRGDAEICKRRTGPDGKYRRVVQ